MRKAELSVNSYSEGRSRKSEVRSQMSDVRDQLSVIGERRAAATHDDVTGAPYRTRSKPCSLRKLHNSGQKRHAA